MIVIDRDRKDNRGNSSGMGRLVLQVREWQAQIQTGTMSVCDFEDELTGAGIRSSLA
jgi:hypothetical protein